MKHWGVGILDANVAATFVVSKSTRSVGSCLSRQPIRTSFLFLKTVSFSTQSKSFPLGSNCISCFSAVISTVAPGRGKRFGKQLLA